MSDKLSNAYSLMSSPAQLSEYKICVRKDVEGKGGSIHMHKDLVVNNKMHVVWWNFATIYKDGSWDVGSFLVGHDKLGYAIVQNEKGEVRCTTDIEGSVRHEKDGWFAEDARIVLEGKEEWEFLPDPKGRMLDFVGGFPITAQQEGRWRRVGDTREPDRWKGAGQPHDRERDTAHFVDLDDQGHVFDQRSDLNTYQPGLAEDAHRQAQAFLQETLGAAP